MQIHLVITHFEPLSCQAGHHRRLPIIFIDNQHTLTNTQVTFPKEFLRDAAAANWRLASIRSPAPTRIWRHLSFRSR